MALSLSGFNMFIEMQEIYTIMSNYYNFNKKFFTSDRSRSTIILSWGGQLFLLTLFWFMVYMFCVSGIPMYIIPDTVIYDPKLLGEFIFRNKITRILFTPSLLETVINTTDIRESFQSLK